VELITFHQLFSFNSPFHLPRQAKTLFNSNKYGGSDYFFSHQLPEDDLDLAAVADDDALEVLGVEYDLVVDDDAVLEVVVLLSGFQLKLGTGNPPPLLLLPFTSFNELRYSLILENRSFLSCLRESLISFRSFFCSESFMFFLTLLVVASTAAFPPL